MTHDWRIRDRSIVFRARHWAVERSLRRRGDDASDHEFHTIRMPDFVVTIAVTEADEVVMVRQFRHGVERPTLEFPGGLVDPGESDLAAAARRELREETGFDGALAPIGDVCPNPALLNNRAHFFAATGARRMADVRLEPTEDVSVVLVTRASLDGLIRSGEIVNALMLAGIALWRLR